MPEAKQMSVAEQEFLAAMVPKMQAGQSFEEAAAAVVAEAEAAWQKYLAMRPEEKAAFVRGMARIVQHNIKARDAVGKLAAAAREIERNPLA